MIEELVNILKGTVDHNQFCLYMVYTCSLKCLECPFNSAENLQKLIDELETK